MQSGSVGNGMREWGTAGTPGPEVWPRPQEEPEPLRKLQPPPRSTPPHTQVSTKYNVLFFLLFKQLLKYLAYLVPLLCLSGMEKERKVSMRLHRGAPVNISSSDLTGRQETSRMSSQVTRTALQISCWKSTADSCLQPHFFRLWHISSDWVAGYTLCRLADHKTLWLETIGLLGGLYDRVSVNKKNLNHLCSVAQQILKTGSV